MKVNNVWKSFILPYFSIFRTHMTLEECLKIH